ncbi:LmbE-like protein [Wallemia mellicola]|nr:LmbE-like protein [Wallemia mellicola]
MSSTSSSLRTLLVIAHPDDEVMFFGPTLNHFRRKGENLHVLCLSSGNADGLGNIREQELYSSLSVLGVQPDNVNLIENAHLQDGMDKSWPEELIANVVVDYAKVHNIDRILTFDKEGVSSHPNHKSIHWGTKRVDLEKCTLRTHSIPMKYSMFSIPPEKSSLTIFSSFGDYIRSIGGMMRHKSQLVWFRVLYILISRYMWINEFDCN